MTISEMRNPLRKYVSIRTLSAGAHEFIMVFACTTSKTKVNSCFLYITISTQENYVKSYLRRKLQQTNIDVMLVDSLPTIYGLVTKLGFGFLRKKFRAINNYRNHNLIILNTQILLEHHF